MTSIVEDVCAQLTPWSAGDIMRQQGFTLPRPGVCGTYRAVGHRWLNIPGHVRPNMTLAALELIFSMTTCPSCNLESTSSLISVGMMSLSRKKISPSSSCISLWIFQHGCSSGRTAAQSEGQPWDVYYHSFVRVFSCFVAWHTLLSLPWNMGSSVATLCIRYSPWPRAIADAVVFIIWQYAQQRVSAIYMQEPVHVLDLQLVLHQLV